MDPDRIYRHSCMMARALEAVGERWSLLIVRDLLLGPRRFTDLARSLSEITPTRLTGRLRQLEAAGLVERDRRGADARSGTDSPRRDTTLAGRWMRSRFGESSMLSSHRWPASRYLRSH
jgi:DNA-binding transcriptional ArsR family regulator